MPKGNSIRFSVSALEKLAHPEKGIATYKDLQHSSLSLYITAQGVKTFFVRKRIKGRDERLIIGRFPIFSIEQARRKATIFCGQIADRKDPIEVERRERLDKLTFGKHFEDYIERYSKLHKKSWKYDQVEINRFLTHWFKKRLSDISKNDVEKLHEKIGQENGPVQANTLIRRLSSIFNKAIQWGWDGTNPTTGVQKFKEKSRDRFIQPSEMSYILQALNEEENDTLRDFISILFYTGARKTNTKMMRWEEINWDYKEWRIPESKNGDPLLIPLIDPVISILKKRKLDAEGPWVFPQAEDAGKFMVEPIKAWHRITGKATLNIWKEDTKISNWISKHDKKIRSYVSPYNKAKRLKELADKDGVFLPFGPLDLRIHDIRRTFGSYQALSGASMAIIGKSLGHKSMKSTQVYARLNLDPVRASIERATGVMLGL
jgi:integrase